MWWQNGIETKVMPNQLGLIQNKKNHEIIEIFMIRIHDDFMLNFFK